MVERTLSPNRERQRRYEQSNREKERDRTRRWRAANASPTERTQYRGMTRAAISARALEQGGCAICSTSPTGLHGWYADVDKSGALRGVLCRPCFHAMGQFQHRVKVLRAAIYYVEAHAHRQAQLKELL